ncbi:MAG: YegS/Rv2252/BmrU family lipid kinase [Lachnospiraceae bacterium]|jgi:YegS/Rv2252/BmrU family lipid kinase|nr:YegS/Rv2252/BmrU family lipid kinase [Lachnospiraceae bacterium]
MRLLFIFNPLAGKAKIRSRLLDIINIFTTAGYTVTAYPTQSVGDAFYAIARLNAKEYDVVVCCGGDGTLDEVVGGMIKHNVHIPLGYIPAGSTNDFAHSLKLSTNMLTAAKKICENRVFLCDVGHFNEVNFVYVAAFGLFTVVTYETKQDIKNIIGHTAYVLEGIKSLADLKTFRMRVVSDNEVIEEEFLFGMVTNSVSVGGFKGITGERVHLDDGLFEVNLAKKPKNPLELSLAVAALSDRSINTDCMYWFKTSRLSITADEEVPWNLDGEFGGRHREVTISNERQALQILC